MVLAKENAASTVGAFPSPLKDLSLEKTVDTTADDGEGYTSDSRQDRGTEKTKELISIFHQRNSPLRGGGQPSPIRTESTMGTSRDQEDREDQKQENNKDKKPCSNPPPLLPQRSDDRTNPFIAITPPRTSDARQLSMSTISSDTNGSFHGDAAQVETPQSKRSTKSEKTTPTRPAMRRGKRTGEQAMRRGNRTGEQVSFSRSIDEEGMSLSETSSTSDDLFLFADLPCTFSEVLCLKTRLATTRKIISTFEGELKRRTNDTPKMKGGNRGLHFEEHFECLMLSRVEEDSLSPVPSMELETEVVPRGNSLVSEITNVVEKLPRCDRVSLLLDLRSKGNSWYIASNHIESSGKRLEFV